MIIIDKFQLRFTENMKLCSIFKINFDIDTNLQLKLLEYHWKNC